MNLKFLGGTLLVTGTSIGGGILALPVVTAGNNLLSSSLLMVAAWLCMMLGALYMLEVLLKLPMGANLIKMGKVYFGPFGGAISLIINIILLYALLCAYITGGGQITAHWLQSFLPHISTSAAALIFTLIMGGVVLTGIQIIDYSNRALMCIKFFALFALMAVAMPHMQAQYAWVGNTSSILKSTTVVITSFGFANIVPSLRVYFKDNIMLLRKAIILGSALPLVIYIIWNIIIHSALPHTGAFSLEAMQQSGNASSQLATALIQITQSTSVKIFANIFTSICVLTSFLGVALALSDLWVDGTGIKKINFKGYSINAALTFIIPLLITVLYPKAFLVALSYAGLCCIILLMLLPIGSAMRARRLAYATTPEYQVQGGSLTLWGTFILAILVLILSLVFF